MNARQQHEKNNNNGQHNSNNIENSNNNINNENNNKTICIKNRWQSFYWTRRS